MKPRLYLETLFNSLTSPNYYLVILNRRFWFSFRFFVISYFFIALLTTIPFVLKDLPYFRTSFEETIQQLERNYPNDLVVNWTGNELTTNTDQPLEITYPEFIPKPSFPQTLAFFDPQVKKPEDISSRIPKSSQAVIGSTTVYSSIPDEGWQTVELKDLPGFEEQFTVTKENLGTYTHQLREIIADFFSWLPVLFPLFYFFVIMPLRFAALFLEILFAFVVLMVISKPLPFSKLFQIGLHIVIIAEIVSIITHIYTIPNFPIFTITFWVYLTLILMNLRNVRAVPKKKEEKK